MAFSAQEEDLSGTDPGSGKNTLRDGRVYAEGMTERRAACEKHKGQ